MKSVLGAFAVLLSLSLGVGAPAHADGYPSRPVKLVVPFAPGGFTDVVARLLAQRLQASLGQSFIVENKPGAGSTIGTEQVAKAAPDGYTLVMVSTTHVIGSALYRNLGYDPIASFTPVAKLVESPYVLLVNSKVPANSVKDFIELAKVQPNAIHYASSGNGSSQHLMGGLFAARAGVQLKHVPYRGSSQAGQDLVAGVVESSFAGVPNALTYLPSGKVKALAVTTAKRSKLMPDVPSLQEAGVPDYDANVWLALLAPAKTPKDIVTRLNAEIVKILNSPDAQQQFTAAGVEPSPSTPEELGEYLLRERDLWSAVVKEAGIKVD
ncbi:Tripartite-type tricarboxylate transporter, receptor component TctC [Noviherbaspirillum humi]|uniref:Tripartite-type tricarboxylate transporter, receptor component TctC n=1 Tax=Noviherbaspirillum humi TaxID=1688639 RepID=A0A239ID93_9BURK|nr:tripartite tricarboxylate transporter substrate binding protein [Noviherbaspirillum humi]SNS91489.1 Tripartite-type tricarboxylate transporter, receptor component TctC [Noviherbaspirillum humi]